MILAKSLCSPGRSPQSNGSHASRPESDEQAFTHLSHTGRGSSWPQQGQGEKLGEAPACQPQTWVRAVPQRGLGVGMATAHTCPMAPVARTVW